MNNILVTGGAGFIGSWVCELLSKRHKVINIDNFDDYYDLSWKKTNVKKALENPNCTFFKADIRNFNKLREIFAENGFDGIIHLAARVGIRASAEDLLPYWDVNVKGVLNLLQLAREFNAKNFVFASSSSVYGINNKIPFSEADNVNNPIFPYAATKRARELMCYAYHHLYQLNVACLKLFTVCGPRGRPDMAPYKFTKLISAGKKIELYGDGTTKRAYTFIADIVSSIIAALGIKGCETINLGNNKPIELKYLISVIEDCIGKKAKVIQKPMQPGELLITWANIRKAKELLNYAPKVGVEEGVKMFWDWYRS